VLICGSCEGPHGELLFFKNGCAIRRCTACGAGQSIPGAFDPESYYTAAYFEGGRADGYSDYGATRHVLAREFAGVERRLRAVLPEGSVLLEIGCAYGYFLETARDAGWEVHGIELSADAVARCHAAGLTIVQQGIADAETLAALPEPDAIVLLDVIEHLADPLETLRLCAQRLRPGGAIYLSTGDFASLHARLAGRGWRLMTPPQHLWFLTPEWLQHTADGIGLHLASVSYPWKQVPFSLILFQIQRLLGLPPKPPPAALSRIGMPMNLFDTMHVVLRKPA